MSWNETDILLAMLLATSQTIRVTQRFCGPPASGNGGYTCGMLAKTLPGAAAVECTIRKPIPIERELRVELREGKAILLDGDEAVIEAAATDYEFELPHGVGLAAAKSAMSMSPAHLNHPFPTCFVCGPERAEHDGLRIFAGPAERQNGFENLFAAPWIPAREFADEEGRVHPEFVWAAMDCPTGFAAGFPYEGKLVTGRLGVKLIRAVRAEDECVLMSWSLGNEGRKCHAGAVLYNSRSEACAIARATWIRLG